MSEGGAALLVDVGSTWTKGLAVALPAGELLARRVTPTTLEPGIMQGVGIVLGELERSAAARIVFRAATSSAAGGLRVAAVGLVPDLTGTAARQASLGAGARVVFTGSYALAAEEIDAMRQQRPDIVLLSGGTDGGNTRVILENAGRLAAAAMPATVVVAGNKSVRAEVRAILEAGGYEVRLAENVLPEVDRLSVESAQEAIRTVFLERIVRARGIEELREWASGALLPTPKAVLDAAAFLADGPLRLGTTLVVDIGGATTDVHSIGGSEALPGTFIRGLPEPRVKRTVEGDLGLRVSAAAATASLGVERLAQNMGTSAQQFQAEAEKRVHRPETILEADPFDRTVAVAAVAEALNRHAGRLEPMPLRKDTWVQIGKDLRRADTLIASGGVFAARADARELLAAALRQALQGGRLIPESPNLVIDREYVLFAVGLLSSRYPEAAAALARRSFGQTAGSSA